MGRTSKDVKSSLGDPERIDPSFNGYEWWIYKKDNKNYAQIGIAENKVVTIFATGSDVNITPFKIGRQAGEIYSSVFFETNISIDYDNSTYRFELSEEDMNTRPIVRIGDAFAQLNIDKFTGALSSVRLLDAPTLIKLRPYELVYRGELPEASSTADIDQEAVEKGIAKQIFDITNIIRVRHESEPLEWDDKTAEVALAHSRDMYDSNQFSHTSERYGELSDRLEAGQVLYQKAGENIAANYIDAIAVVEGWLNSKGHRESLLNDQFTHLGVGVYKKHYTQNFIEK